MKGSWFGGTLALAVVIVVLAMALGGLVVASYGEDIPIIGPLLGEGSDEAASSPVVVEDIQRLSELSTVQFTESVYIIKETEEGVLPKFLTQEKLLLAATGEVEAGVNLNEVGQDDVSVEEERVTIDLPEPRILNVNLDEEETRLYDRDRGWLVLRGNDDLIEDARLEAEDKILEAAKEGGILQQAENNAEDSIRVFVNSLGYKEVTFT